MQSLAYYEYKINPRFDDFGTFFIINILLNLYMNIGHQFLRKYFSFETTRNTKFLQEWKNIMSKSSV